MRQDFEALLEMCRAKGLSPVEVHLPHPDEVLPIHGIIFSVEAMAFHLGRFAEHEHEYPPVAREMFRYARTLRAEDYVRAVRRREDLTRRVDALFGRVDFVLTPTLPLLRADKTAAGFTIGKKSIDFTFALIRYTALFDHTGHPVVAMPMGLSGPGVASSVQVISPRHADKAAVEFARELEQSLNLIPDRTISAACE